MRKLFKSSFCRNLFKSDIKLNDKKTSKSHDKFINKKIAFDVDININIKNINLNKNETKNINLINIKPAQNIKIITESKINDNNIKNPVNIISNNKNVYKKKISNQKQSSTTLPSKNQTELYNQKIDIKCMKKSPPKLPKLFCHNYNFEENETISKSNETFGKLNKDRVPIIFYGHLLINKSSKKIANNRNKCMKTSITQRNKLKLLTIVYYSP